MIHDGAYKFKGEGAPGGLRAGDVRHLKITTAGGYIFAEYHALRAWVKLPYNSHSEFYNEWDVMPCSRPDCVKSRNEAERLQGRLDDIMESQSVVMREPCDDDRVHCTCVPTLKREVMFVFGVLSKDCDFRGTYTTLDDGEEIYDETACTINGIGECDYYTCGVLKAERAE